MFGGNNESTHLSNSKIVSPSIPELSFRHAYVPFLLHDKSSVHSNRKLQGYSHSIPDFVFIYGWVFFLHHHYVHSNGKLRGCFPFSSRISLSTWLCFCSLT